MNDHHSFSALDRHAVLTGSDDGFPWFADTMLAIEAGASWLAGATPAPIVNRYREHVAENIKRLSVSHD